ncbi:PspC domain-containing protein [Ligilactobacillus sp. Marseille-Q7487]|jgi:phage shock protein C|uniref:PspC domain-containing protein n=1 Tax=Ligilactobacillus sp. Marseille-Q7487 TaxID=3022128 RepID=UPI0015B75D61|nr:PspC domain-containing protein [Ligilactobacillus sp. Marseille-Q7487]
MKKRLTKSKDKVLSGVFGGIAEYFGWDKALVRIIGAFIIIVPGTIITGVVLYFIAALVMPDAPNANNYHRANNDDVIEGHFYEKDE